MTFLLALGLLAACQRPTAITFDQTPQAARVDMAPNETLLITPGVWSAFETYKSLLVLQGAFVVAETGDGSGYSYCPGIDCRPQDYTRQAIEQCEEAGVKCVVFAEGSGVLVDYEIVD